tara:strand:- start:3293 stop:3487 length:195 start_codon:yes stop_codon:yes gene_type:complete
MIHLTFNDNITLETSKTLEATKLAKQRIALGFKVISFKTDDISTEEHTAIQNYLNELNLSTGGK